MASKVLETSRNHLKLAQKYYDFLIFDIQKGKLQGGANK